MFHERSYKIVEGRASGKGTGKVARRINAALRRLIRLAACFHTRNESECVDHVDRNGPHVRLILRGNGIEPSIQRCEVVLPYRGLYVVPINRSIPQTQGPGLRSRGIRPGFIRAVIVPGAALKPKK